MNPSSSSLSRSHRTTPRHLSPSKHPPLPSHEAPYPEENKPHPSFSFSCPSFISHSPLSTTWVMYYSYRSPQQRIVNYANEIKPLATLSTVWEWNGG
ncbi:hypothetical protein HMI54_002443 [Coelomomyces lativittatus]|nr:hypothetical protein HMI56_003841 [Coelomomyces lativittatus]KAJ1509362.1 hypothetical protein HMI54_002443 [Coelomomyces lativittatus]